MKIEQGSYLGMSSTSEDATTELYYLLFLLYMVIKFRYFKKFACNVSGRNEFEY